MTMIFLLLLLLIYNTNAIPVTCETTLTSIYPHTYNATQAGTFDCVGYDTILPLTDNNSNLTLFAPIRPDSGSDFYFMDQLVNTVNEGDTSFHFVMRFLQPNAITHYVDTLDVTFNMLRNESCIESELLPNTVCVLTDSGTTSNTCNRICQGQCFFAEYTCSSSVTDFRRGIPYFFDEHPGLVGINATHSDPNAVFTLVAIYLQYQLDPIFPAPFAIGASCSTKPAPLFERPTLENGRYCSLCTAEDSDAYFGAYRGSVLTHTVGDSHCGKTARISLADNQFQPFFGVQIPLSRLRVNSTSFATRNIGNVTFFANSASASIFISYSAVLGSRCDDIHDSLESNKFENSYYDYNYYAFQSACLSGDTQEPYIINYGENPPTINDSDEYLALLFRWLRSDTPSDEYINLYSVTVWLTDGETMTFKERDCYPMNATVDFQTTTCECATCNDVDPNAAATTPISYYTIKGYFDHGGPGSLLKRRTLENLESDVIDYDTSFNMDSLMAESRASQILYSGAPLQNLTSMQQFLDSENCGIYVSVNDCSSTMQIWLNAKIHEPTTLLLDGSEMLNVGILTSGLAYETVWPLTWESVFVSSAPPNTISGPINSSDQLFHQFRFNRPNTGLYSSHWNATFGVEIALPRNSPIDGFYFISDLQVNGRAVFNNSYYCQANNGTNLTKTSVATMAIGVDASHPTPVRFHLFGTTMCQPEVKLSLCPRDGWYFNTGYRIVVDYVGPAYSFPGLDLNYHTNVDYGMPDAIFPFDLEFYFDLSKLNLKRIGWDGFNTNGNRVKQLAFLDDPENSFYVKIYSQQEVARLDKTYDVTMVVQNGSSCYDIRCDDDVTIENEMIAVMYTHSSYNHFTTKINMRECLKEAVNKGIDIFGQGKMRVFQTFHRNGGDYDDKEDTVDRVFIHGVAFEGKNGSTDVYRPRINGDAGLAVGVDGVDYCDPEPYNYECTCNLEPYDAGVRLFNQNTAGEIVEASGECNRMLKITKNVNYYVPYIGISIPLSSIGLNGKKSSPFITDIEMHLYSENGYAPAFAAYQRSCGVYSIQEASPSNDAINAELSSFTNNSCIKELYHTKLNGNIQYHGIANGDTAILVLFEAFIYHEPIYIENITLTYNNLTTVNVPITDCVFVDNSCACLTCDGSDEGSTDLKWFVSDVSLIKEFLNPGYVAKKKKRSADGKPHDNYDIRAQIVDNKLDVIYQTKQFIHPFKPSQETLSNVSKTQGNMSVGEYMIRNSNCGIMLSVEECTGDLNVWLKPKPGFGIPIATYPNDETWLSFKCRMLYGGQFNQESVTPLIDYRLVYIRHPDINPISVDYDDYNMDHTTQRWYVAQMFSQRLSGAVNYTLADVYGFKIRRLNPDDMRQGLYLSCDVALAESTNDIFYRLFEGMDYCQLNSFGGYDKTNVTFFGNLTDYTTYVAPAESQSQSETSLHKREAVEQRGGGPPIAEFVPPSIVITASPQCEEWTLCPKDGWFIDSEYSYMADYVGPSYVIPPYVDGETFDAQKKFDLTARLNFDKPEMLDLIARYRVAKACFDLPDSLCTEGITFYVDLHIDFPFRKLNHVSNNILLIENVCYADTSEYDSALVSSCASNNFQLMHGQYNVYGQPNPFVEENSPLGDKYLHDHYIVRVYILSTCLSNIIENYNNYPLSRLGLEIVLDFGEPLGKRRDAGPDYAPISGHSLWSGVKIGFTNNSYDRHVYYRAERDCAREPFVAPVACNGVCPIYLYDFNILDNTHPILGQAGNHPNSSDYFNDVIGVNDDFTSFEVYDAIGKISDVVNQVYDPETIGATLVTMMQQLIYEGNGLVMHFRILTEGDFNYYHQYAVFTFDPSIIGSVFNAYEMSNLLPLTNPGIFIDSDPGPDGAGTTRIFGNCVGVMFTLFTNGSVMEFANVGIPNFRIVYGVVDTMISDTDRDVVNLDADVISSDPAFLNVHSDTYVAENYLQLLAGSNLLIYDMDKIPPGQFDLNDHFVYGSDYDPEVLLEIKFVDNGASSLVMGDGIDEEGLFGALPVVDTLYTTFGGLINTATGHEQEFMFPYFRFEGDYDSVADTDYDAAAWEGGTIISEIEITGRIRATLFPCATTCSHNATHKVKNHPDANLNSLVADVLNPATVDENNLVDLNGNSFLGQPGDIGSWQHANKSDIFTEEGQMRMGMGVFTPFPFVGPDLYITSVHNFDGDRCYNILRSIGSPLEAIQGNYSFDVTRDLGMYMNMRNANRRIEFYGITCTSQMTTPVSPYALPAHLEPLAIQLSMIGYVQKQFSTDYSLAPKHFTRSPTDSTLTYNGTTTGNNGYFDVLAKIDSYNFTTNILAQGRFNATLLFNPNATFPSILTIDVYEPVNHTVQVHSRSMDIQNYGSNQNTSFMGILEKCSNMFDDATVFYESKSQSHSESSSPENNQQTFSQSESDSKSQSESESFEESKSESSSPSIAIHLGHGAAIAIDPEIIYIAWGGLFLLIVGTALICYVTRVDDDIPYGYQKVE